MWGRGYVVGQNTAGKVMKNTQTSEVSNEWSLSPIVWISFMLLAVVITLVGIVERNRSDSQAAEIAKQLAVEKAERETQERVLSVVEETITEWALKDTVEPLVVVDRGGTVKMMPSQSSRPKFVPDPNLVTAMQK
jgi:hypothetical protein